MKGDYKRALEINNLKLEVARKYDTTSLPPALVGMANLKYFHLNDKLGAFTILEDLLKNEENLNAYNQSLANTEYGIYLYYDGNYEKALWHYLKALESQKKVNPEVENLGEIANCHSNIAEVYMDLKQYDLAKVYLDSVKQLGINNISRSRQKNVLNYQLRLAMETNRDSREVTKLVDSIYKYQNEVYLQNSENELLELTKANERQRLLSLEKQASDIENIKLQTRSIILITSLVLLTLIGVLLYGRRKLKFEKQSLQLQQRLFRSQMNPHFTYNTLYAIQKEIKTDAKSAENYLLKFSRLLRLVLENSMNNYVLLSKELEAIQKYLDIQLIHAPNRFSYEVHLENMEEDELVFIPPMLLQPLIENSIEHGFSGIDYTGQLTLKLTLEEKFIGCTIEDNGVGLKKGVNSEKQSASTKLIQDFLKKSTKKGFSILNKQDQNSKETGLIVQFLIPYKFTEND
jgi:LytS/YehU family sensor histidine kinase